MKRVAGKLRGLLGGLGSLRSRDKSLRLTPNRGPDMAGGRGVRAI